MVIENKNTLAISIGKNSSVCLIAEGKIIVYLIEERFSKIKADPFPFRILDEVLYQNQYQLSQIIIGGVDQNLPLLPNSNIDLYQSIIQKTPQNSSLIGYLTHQNHLSYAYSAFHNSGFEEATAIIVNEEGSYKDNKTFKGVELESIIELKRPNLSNIIWQSFQTKQSPNNNSISNETYSLSNSGGISQIYDAVINYINFSSFDIEKLASFSAFGSFNELLPPLIINKKGNKNVFNFEPYKKNSIKYDFYPIFIPSKNKNILNFQKDLAYAVQQETQIHLGDLIENAHKKTKNKNIVLGGSYILNPVSNTYIKNRFPELNIYFNPIPNSSGISLGLSKQNWFVFKENASPLPFTTPYLGTFSSREDIERVLNNSDITFLDILPTSISEVALILSKNQSIAIFQGRSESTTQSLGNRSILHNPLDPKVKKHLRQAKNNNNIFSTFPITILHKDFTEWFDTLRLEESPYMMFVMDVLPSKLSNLRYIKHINNTCRVQTLKKEQNPNYYKLIHEFHKITNIPLVVNTSFNVHDSPIVENFEDALRTFFLLDGLNYLYLPEENLLIRKKNTKYNK